jgi:uncharacterized protein (DUF2164 family)
MKERTLSLDEEHRMVALDEIKKYFLEERDEDLGDLAAGLVLDFFVERIGPLLYNQGLDDAQAWLSRRLEDLEADYRALQMEPRR